MTWKPSKRHPGSGKPWTREGLGMTVIYPASLKDLGRFICGMDPTWYWGSILVARRA